MATSNFLNGNRLLSVSIHATLAGGDRICANQQHDEQQFLSTPPSRVATRLAFFLIHHIQCFYPRHPRGWRRTGYCISLVDGVVSIHATLAGGDGDGQPRAVLSCGFYPRHPRGWRLTMSMLSSRQPQFLSTPPSRVATIIFFDVFFNAHVSIHATLAGGDRYES